VAALIGRGEVFGKMVGKIVTFGLPNQKLLREE
jgi:hypothetical protein